MPNIGDHTLFSIMTTEPNAVVEPIHEKAMPVMLMTPDDVEQWLRDPGTCHRVVPIRVAIRVAVRCDSDLEKRG